MNHSIPAWIIQGLTISVLLFGWEIAAYNHWYHVTFFPPPSQIIHTLIADVMNGLMLEDLSASLRRALVGFVLGGSLGVLAGILTALTYTLGIVLHTIINIFRPIPIIAYVPLVVLWFGLGEPTKYILVTLGVFFSVWLNTHHGIKEIERDLVDAANIFAGGSKLYQIWHVYLPCSFPFIVTGLRLGVAVSFYALVAAELAGAFSGIAYRMEVSNLAFRVDRMLANLVVLSLMSLSVDALLRWVIKGWFAWEKISTTKERKQPTRKS